MHTVTQTNLLRQVREERLINGLAEAITVPMETVALAANLVRVRQWWSRCLEKWSVCTIRLNTDLLGRWVKYWRTTGGAHALTSREVLESFLQFATEQNLSPGTTESYVRALIYLKKGLGEADLEFAFAARNANCKLIESLAAVPTRIRPLGRDAIERIIAAADPLDARDVRDIALLLLSYESASRPVARLALDRSDLRPNKVLLFVQDLTRRRDGRYRLALREGRIREPVDLSAHCSEWIDRWLAMSGHESGPLFRMTTVGSESKYAMAPLGRVYAVKRLKDLAERAGLEPTRIGARSAALGMAADLLRAGHSYKEVRAIARIGSISSNMGMPIGVPGVDKTAASVVARTPVPRLWPAASPAPIQFTLGFS